MRILRSMDIRKLNTFMTIISYFYAILKELKDKYK